MNYADAAIAPAHILQDIHEYMGVLQGKWHIIVPWIEDVYFSKPKKKMKNAETLLFTGSLIEFKGAWVLARAIKKIAARFPKLQVIFAGPDQEQDNRFRKDIEIITEQEGTLEHIQFVGKKTPHELFMIQQKATAYICPTVCMESFGLNWAEAMAAGCTVIASNISSIPEYITHKHNGMLFTPREPDALANTVIEVLSNKKLAKEISIHGKEYAKENFTRERAFQEILQLYERVSLEKT
jgi:glycosyltransferase involved in cell wall biosynthesis